MPGSASRSPRRLAARFPFPRPAPLPAGRGGDGVVLPLACLFGLIGPVEVSSCGRAVSISRSGSLPWYVRRADGNGADADNRMASVLVPLSSVLVPSSSRIRYRMMRCRYLFMSCPLPHALVLLNLSRRLALLFGEALRRAFVLSSIAPLPACSPRVLSPLFPPLCSSGGTTWQWASALFAIAIVMAMRRSFDCVLLGSLCFPSAYRPASRHG